MSTERDEDEMWRSIVANFGERAQLDDEPAPQAGDDAPAAPAPATAPPVPSTADTRDDEAEEPFVPPIPPPAPRLPLPKRLAWIAVLGSPALLVVTLLVSVDLPAPGAYALVAAFVGGFGYLVATMQRSRPDAWDDGAQL